MRPDIEDRICLSVPKGPTDPEMERRWWSIRQPVPSVAFSLQGRLLAALGPGIVETIHRLLATSGAVTDPLNNAGNPSHLLDAKMTQETLGDAHALRVLRRARAGQCLVSEGEPLQEAGTRLRALLRWIAPRTGADLQAPLLLGEAKRLKDNLVHGWERAALIHQLLLSSELTFLGSAEMGWEPSGMEDDTSPGGPLFRAMNQGSVTGFVTALDHILISAEELMLLSIWATVHLFRPF